MNPGMKRRKFSAEKLKAVCLMQENRESSPTLNYYKQFLLDCLSFELISVQSLQL